MRGRRSCAGSIEMRQQYNKAQASIWSVTVKIGRRAINRERRRIRSSLLQLKVARLGTDDPDFWYLIDRQLRVYLNALDDLDRAVTVGALFEGPPKAVTVEQAILELLSKNDH
jgi:hypothetical protein